MFLDNSRYARLTPTNVKTCSGREVAVIHLRRLPAVSGAPHTVHGNDRLDIIAQRTYGDPTCFWHIADANTEIEAKKLLQPVNRVIKVPEQ
jgi:hypothetical protein